MQSLKTINPGEDAWNAFVASHPQAHLLQATPWGELKSRFGWDVQRVALADASQNIVAGAQILYRRLPFGLGLLAYAPKGPLVDWQDSDLTARLVAALDQAARQRGALALSVEPELPDTPSHAADLGRAGFVPGLSAYQPRRTILVDLGPGEAHILGAMKSKTRYNVRLAARKGVNVYQGSNDDVEIFNQLAAITGERNSFGVRSPAYHRAAYELFAPHGQAALFLAEYQGQPLAGVLAFGLGRVAWYFYGASSNAQRNLMAPYAVQWEAMRWARARGCTTYDLWGVPDEDDESLESQFAGRSDGLWGVYRFKRGFGGALWRSVGAWDRVYRPLRYRLYGLALRLR
jgi:lipid II:glycine glycyltransferase (peptidoglycan interpeptide bridge formation enzyme)